MDFELFFNMYREYFVTALLALIQSLTEFLPVSSSGHLLLTESLGISSQSIFTDISLHIGTLFAVLIYFHKWIWKMLKNCAKDCPESHLACNLIVATIPIVLAVLAASEVFLRLRSPLVIGGLSIVFGLALWLVDACVKPKTNLRTMSVTEAFYIGVAQILALVPGVSRSGVVITCCRLLGYDRSESTRFAMLLSIPTIGGAGVWMLYEAIKAGVWRDIFSGVNLMGIFLAMVFGLLVLYFLMNLIRKTSFMWFGIYRILLGIFILRYFLG